MGHGMQWQCLPQGKNAACRSLDAVLKVVAVVPACQQKGAGKEELRGVSACCSPCRQGNAVWRAVHRWKTNLVPSLSACLQSA